MFLNACRKDTDNADTPLSSPVGFTLSSRSRTDYKLLITPSAQSITGLLNIKVQTGTAAAATTVKLADSTAYLVSRYNTANGTSILPLPHDRWSMPAELVIAQGGTSASGTITVAHTDGLDFNKLYAIGITIGSNNGYTIPDSSRNLLLSQQCFRDRTTATSNLVGPYNGEIIGPVYSPLATYNAVSYTNYHDAATGTVYLAFDTNLGAGGVMIPGVSRVWIDTLTYLGPR